MSNFQQNEDGWAVASSRKGKNANKGGASSGGYTIPTLERPGIGALKGKQWHNVDGQKPGVWGNNPNGGSSGASEAWKTTQKNGNLENTRGGAHKNIGARGSVGGRGLDGGANSAWQNKPSYEARGTGSGSGPAVSNAWTGRQNVGVPPALSNGWQWGNRSSSSVVGAGKDEGTGEGNAGGSAENSEIGTKFLPKLLPSEQSVERPQNEDGYQSSDCAEEEEEIEELDSDDVMSSDDYDSDGPEITHEAMKKNKWFMSFFQSLDKLSIEQLNEPERQWHCPACRGGVGAIDWYRGMQPILAHAKTMRSRRVKLHRKLADVLEEELTRRGAGCVISEEMFGKWKGLQESALNKQIVWPPIIIIQNTVLDQDENEQWVGMGNKELLEYFKGYKAMKARHAYGPRGHRGMSVLIFEESALGYMEAERLHQHFLKEGRGKEGWERPGKVLFHPGGKRVLYGYLATKEEMEIFNRHSKGKSRLKYDMRSYHEMVVESMKQMSEDNQKLIYYKNKVAKEQENSKTLEETVKFVSSKLQMREAEVKIIRQRATEQHEECKKEMDYLEQSYRQQIDQLNEDILKREHNLEKMQQDFKISQLDRCQQLEADSANLLKDKAGANGKQHEEQMKINNEIARYTAMLETSFKDSEDYERERQELIKAHDKKRREIKLKQLQEEVAFEKKIEQERLKLLEKYAKKTEVPNCSEEISYF